jgi:hypothetical protein
LWPVDNAGVDLSDARTAETFLSRRARQSTQNCAVRSVSLRRIADIDTQSNSFRLHCCVASNYNGNTLLRCTKSQWPITPRKSNRKSQWASSPLLMTFLSPWDVEKKTAFLPHSSVVGIVRDCAGMVQKIRCCIATVRIDDFPARRQIVNSLFQIISLVPRSLACRLRVHMR